MELEKVQFKYNEITPWVQIRYLAKEHLINIFYNQNL